MTYFERFAVLLTGIVIGFALGVFGFHYDKQHKLGFTWDSHSPEVHQTTTTHAVPAKGAH